MPRFALYLLALALVLAGCPAPQRYVVTDVTMYRAPVEDALVAARCGQPHGGATRTDRSGRARLVIGGEDKASRCVLTVAKPGLSTVEVDGVNACNVLAGCPATPVELAPGATMWRAQ